MTLQKHCGMQLPMQKKSWVKTENPMQRSRKHNQIMDAIVGLKMKGNKAALEAMIKSRKHSGGKQQICSGYDRRSG